MFYAEKTFFNNKLRKTSAQHTAETTKRKFVTTSLLYNKCIICQAALGEILLWVQAQLATT